MSKGKIAVAAVVILLAAGCASAESEANVPDHITFSKAAPGDVTKAARKVLDTLPKDERENHHGVVVSVSTPDQWWYVRVVTRDGVVVLEQGPCGDDWRSEEWLRQFVVPGDVIRWTSVTGELCASQLKVVDPGGALPGSS